MSFADYAGPGEIGGKSRAARYEADGGRQRKASVMGELKAAWSMLGGW